ncbi:MAG: hypothetical protein ABR526_02920 [Chthoniobacterales bacterium]
MIPPLRFLELAVLPPELVFAVADLLELLAPALRLAQRAFAAAANFARVAADIGRLRPSVLAPLLDEEAEELLPPPVLLLPPPLPLPPKSELSRSSSD